MRGRASAVLHCRGKAKRGRTQGMDLNHLQFPMAAPFKPQQPQKPGMRTSPTPHASLLHRCARVAASPPPRAPCHLFLQQPPYGHPTQGPPPRGTTTGAGEAIREGVYCRTQIGGAGKKREKPMSSLLQGGTQGGMPSAPSAAGEGGAKLSEMDRGFGRSRKT